MMKTIQKASEQVLLFFYALKTSEGYISEEVIEFERDGKWIIETDDKKIKRALKEITDDSVLLIKNSLQYLHDKKLISYRSKGTLDGHVYIYEIDLTATGVDIIEGIDGAKTEKERYQIVFNVQLAETINVESLIKTELGPLVSLFPKLF